MTKREYQERATFADVIAAESQNAEARHIADLFMRHGRTYARLQEANCNGLGTWYSEYSEDPKSFAKRQDRFEKRIEKREGQIEKRLTVLAAQLGPGFAVVFQGDPRGVTVKLTLPSGKTNDFGCEAFCVPGA
jgi:hypothetical protein